MKPIRQPRCPQHPTMRVSATWFGWPRGKWCQVPVWTCLVCGRELGIASTSREMDNLRIGFTATGQPAPSRMNWLRRDHDWLFAHGADETLTPYDQWQRKARGRPCGDDWLTKAHGDGQ